MNGLMQEQMLSKKDRADIDKEMRMLWFLWAGVIGCPIAIVITCHVVARLMGENIPIREDFPLGVLEIVLSFVGLLSLAIAYFLRKSFSEGKWEIYKERSIKLAATSHKPCALAPVPHECLYSNGVTGKSGDIWNVSFHDRGGVRDSLWIRNNLGLGCAVAEAKERGIDPVLPATHKNGELMDMPSDDL